MGVYGALLGLAGEAGSLLSEFKKWMRQGEIYRPFPNQVSEEIGDILWYISNIASKMDLDLEEIAGKNLAQLQDRWGKSGTPQAELFGKHLRRYDEHFPENEQLPRSVRAEFRMIMEHGRRKLSVSLDGTPCGDSLTDNSHFEDGYRFHDCFHITLAILFGGDVPSLVEKVVTPSPGGYIPGMYFHSQKESTTMSRSYPKSSRVRKQHWAGERRSAARIKRRPWRRAKCNCR